MEKKRRWVSKLKRGGDKRPARVREGPIRGGGEGGEGNKEVPKFARLLNRLEKIVVILRLSEDWFSPPSPVQDMIPGIGIFDSERARHGPAISDKAKRVKSRLDPFS